MTNYQVCYLGRLVWCGLVLGCCTFLVFWKQASGWWYVLALLLCGGDCKATLRKSQ